jgi:phage terminase small subunit
MTKQEQKKKALKPKQEKFCQEYVVLMNATKAALNAGYSKDSAYSIGSENLKKPEIKARIAELRKEIEEQFYYSRTMSFKKLEEAQQKALSKTLYTKDGDEYDAPDLAAFIKAEELKGKMCGLYEPEVRSEININCMGNIKVNGKELSLKVGKEPQKQED